MKKLFLKGASMIALAAVIASCSVTLPITASNAPIGSKRGVSKSVVIGGTLYLNKNFGIKDAANNGKITSAIATIDKKSTSYVFFQKVELIVTAQ